MLRLEIVTPEKKIFCEDVDSVVIPASEGEIGVLPGHVPLMAHLAPGDLCITGPSGTFHMAIGMGFVEIGGDKVAVLTDMAVPESEIDEEAAAEAARRAEEAMRDQKLGTEEYATVKASLQKSLALVRVKRNRPI